MTEHLFQDDALRGFLAGGYTLVASDQPADFHLEICERLDYVLEKEGNPGNNILPRVPQIQRVFETPSVHSALTRILGPGYVMHPHRYCHLRRPGAKAQGWHKDDYVYDQKVRHHRGRWAMAFYYPQAVTADMGPSSIAPGHQHYNTTAQLEADGAAEMAITGQAGTVAIVNFDSWHRGCVNTSNSNRYMLKFQFLRMEEPTPFEAGRWDEIRQDGAASHVWEGTHHDGVASHVWDWLRGSTEKAGDFVGDIDTAVDHLCHGEERARLQAMYSLAALGERAVAPLVDALCSEAAACSESNLATSPANPAGGNPADLATAHALAATGIVAIDALVNLCSHDHWAVRATATDVLGTIGRQGRGAAPALQRALEDENIWVRRNGAEALGTIGDATGVEMLAHILSDEDWRVRLNAAGSLARIGRGSDGALSALKPLLEDENRYVRANALNALQRIDTPESRETLYQYLLVSRWCATTSLESHF